MKAKGDENRMKGKEDERKRATEKHNFFFFFENWSRKWFKWKIPQRRDENREWKKEEKWRNRK